VERSRDQDDTADPDRHKPRYGGTDLRRRVHTRGDPSGGRRRVRDAGCRRRRWLFGRRHGRRLAGAYPPARSRRAGMHRGARYRRRRPGFLAEPLRGGRPRGPDRDDRQLLGRHKYLLVAGALGTCAYRKGDEPGDVLGGLPGSRLLRARRGARRDKPGGGVSGRRGLLLLTALLGAASRTMRAAN
jgi:hypothetical protein